MHSEVTMLTNKQTHNPTLRKTSSAVRYVTTLGNHSSTRYFDILTRLGVNHQCDDNF